MKTAGWILLMLLPCLIGVSCEYLMGGHLDNSEPSRAQSGSVESSSSLARTVHLEDIDSDADGEEITTIPSILLNDDSSLRYSLPFPFAFNGGRPFSLEKDPITGKIDYEKAPSVKAVNYTNRYSDEKEQSETRNVDDEETPAVEEPSSENEQTADKQNDNVNPNEINPYLPNFHDFLNLPVHYSSDKYGQDKYPLISNSYANTKVQSGSSSYSIYNHRPNHRPYHTETTYYYPTKKPYVPKTTTTTMTITTSTTPRYVHPTTRFTTTPRPLTTSFTTSESSTVTSTVATKLFSTNVATTTKAPPITTWKPLSTSIKNRVQQTEGYDDTMHYMDMLQASIYGGNNPTPNNVVSSQKDTLTKPSTNNEDYDDGDGYEDYSMHEELGEENDYVPVKEVTKELPKITTATASSTSIVPDTTVTITTRPTVRPSTPPSFVPTTQSDLKQQENIFVANPVQLQVLPHRPVTSMPLDNDNREVLPLENVIDGRRPIISNLGILESNNKPSHIGNQRPVGLGSGIVVESTSNIIVPPGQDTVSFVLGNRQNVDDKYYSTGTAIGESPYGDLTGIDGSFQSGFNTVSSASGQINFEPQKGNHESIALPSIAVVDPTFSYGAQKWRSPNSSPTSKISNEIEPSKVAVLSAQGPPHLEEKDEIQSVKNNVAFPAAEGGDFVTFPSSEAVKPNVEEHIVIINEADGSIREITPTTTIKPFVDPAVANNDGLPQLSESLTPPAKRPRPLPPYYFHYQHSNAPRPDYPKLQRLPLPPRGKLPPPVPLSLHPEPLGLRRRPYSPDSKLPNILPQFRPNAKTSHGHRDPETIGTITATQPFSTRVRQPSASHLSSRRPLPPLPSHLQRLNPPPPPIHALRLTVAPSAKMESVVPLHQDAEGAVKRYRVPVSTIASRRDEDDRPSQNNNYSPNQKAKVHVEEEERPERYSEEPPHVPPRPPLFPKRRTADSPQVETLQMIQQRTELEKNEDELNFSFSENVDEEPDKEIDEETADYRKTENQDAIVDSPVYVVYPVNTAVNIQPDDYRDKDESVVVGTRGPHRPLPPENLLQDKEDEKIKVNDESSLGLDLYKRPITVNFSYPIDRHDSSLFISGIKETPLLIPSDQRQQEGPLHTKDRSEEKDDKDTSVNVIPYLQDFVPFPTRKNGAAISATLHRVPIHPSSTPLAYVYTPTAQVSHQLDIDIKDEGTTNIGREDEKQILLPSQQPSSSSSSAPSPQNFMAPFVASVSAEAPAKNGWSVVVLDQSTNGSSTDEQDKANHLISSAQTQTEKAEFDVENFKPQLFGGFKPIYEFPTDDGERSNHHAAISAESETSRHIKETSVSTA